jgi:hypothetical protein
MKKQHKLFALLIVTLMTISTFAFSTSASISQLESKRGTVLAWTKDTVQWTYTSSNISSSDAWQGKGGINVQNLGINKQNASTSTKHVYMAKNSSTIGLSVGGVTIGYEVVCNDRLTVYSSGSTNVEYDV